MEFISLSSVLETGGLYKNISGSTTEEVFSSICKTVALPSGISADELYDALCAREAINPTSVGNGIAIPHSKTPLVKNNDEQKVVICYLKEPIDMNAPDGRKVFVMFLILSSNVHFHQQMIVQLAAMFKRSDFRHALEQHADLKTLLKFAS
ncbi:MAG: PTS sugar transporter subunit IIA [Treponema sp.]|nr:PTS sugar transporter subunit IIA [Treponema sp.]